MTNRHAIIESELGPITLVAEGGDLVGVYFASHRPRPDRGGFGPAVRCLTDPVLGAAGRQLEQYLAGQRTSFELPARVAGSTFERRVWDAVGVVPYGETMSYGELAETLGNRSWAREVGIALSRNHLCLVVACHRVVGKDGRLTGYAGGIEAKRRLLHLESSNAADAVRPGALTLL